MKQHYHGKGPEKVTVGNVSVKIYSRLTKAGSYRVWEVADYSHGSRRLRSFSDHNEARREAEKIARLMASGEAHAAQMRGTDAASYGRAIELLRPTGLPIEVAAAVVAEAVKILGGNRIIEAAKEFARRHPETMPAKPVADVVAELLEMKKGKASLRHLEDLRARLNRFAEAFKVNVATITGPDVQRWLDGFDAAPQTVKNYRTVVHQLFQFAERRGYIVKGSNPVADTEKPEVKNGGSVEIYTPGELARLLSAAPANFLPSLAIGAFAGLRSAEIERLDWREIDLAGGHITVAADKAKTASRRIVPIVPALAAWLTPYAKKTGLVWTGDHKEFYEAQKATATAAGLSWKTNALRHSFISYRLADIQNAAQVALEAGNSAAVIFKHYRELVRPDAAQRWFSVTPNVPINVIAVGGHQ